MSVATANRRHTKQGQQRQHGNGRDVLEEKDGKTGLPARCREQVFFVEGLQDDGGRRQGEYAADGNADLPCLPPGNGDADNGRQSQPDLQSAQAEQFVAQPPKHLRRELQADKKQHHDDAELGNVLDGFGFFADEAQYRADEDAGHQVAQYRSQPQFLRNQYRADGKGHVDKGVQQYFSHGVFCLPIKRFSDGLR